MNGNRVTTPRHYFLGATVLIAVGLVLGLGLSAGETGRELRGRLGGGARDRVTIDRDGGARRGHGKARQQGENGSFHA